MKINWVVVFIIGIVLLLVVVLVLVSLSNKSDCEELEGKDSIYEWKTGRCFKTTKERCDFYKHNYQSFNPKKVCDAWYEDNQ